MLAWLQGFGTFCFLDNQQYNVAPHQVEWLAAAGDASFIEGDNLPALDAFLQKGDWVFGHLAYSLSASLHGFSNTKTDRVGFAPYRFFVPQVVVEFTGNGVDVYAADPQQAFAEISATLPASAVPGLPVEMQHVLHKEAYIQIIEELQRQIRRGNCYEINFCQEAFAEGLSLHPLSVYQKLAALSPNPFSAFYKTGGRFLLCASPERYVSRKGTTILSQPIKGTIKRDVDNAAADEALKQELRHSPKDQAENVMVVDLVRNDLTRICKDASVRVNELYGVYTYPQVHQLISTVSGQLREDVSFSQIIAATFPMGSMTGAPKHRVMQLIEEYEASARGIFSGAVGYIRPGGDFDFNVVIRSLMYNEASGYLSYQVGSGITTYSDAAQEWEECLLKAAAIKEVLKGEGG